MTDTTPDPDQPPAKRHGDKAEDLIEGHAEDARAAGAPVAGAARRDENAHGGSLAGHEPGSTSGG